MTLLEVLLAIALSSIFFCMLFPTLGTLQRVVLQAEAKEMMEMDMRGALYFIEDEIRLANQVCIQLEGEWLTTEDDVYVCSLYAKHKHSVSETIREDFDKQQEHHIKSIHFYDGTKVEDADEESQLKKKTLQIVCKTVGVEKEKTYTISYQSQVLIEGIEDFTVREEAGQLVLTLSGATSRGGYQRIQLIPNLQYKM